jgi:hypothetical protein
MSNNGGLVQLVNYGNQDIMLTGTPEITYFRIVFRRYTNFGLNTHEIPFDNDVKFGSYLTSTIPKSNGDLLTRLTLKIKLPTINLTELNNVILSTVKINENTLEQYLIYYSTLLKFINKLKNIVNVFFSNNDENNTLTYIEDLKIFILQYLTVNEYLEFYITINFFFNNKIITKTNVINTALYMNSSLFKLSQNNVIVYIFENFNETTYNFEIFKASVYSNMEILDKLNITVYDMFKDVITSNNLITAGWIKDIGIYITKNIELTIGSNIIQKLSNDYINNYGLLHYKNNKLYNTIIGNSTDTHLAELIKNERYLYLQIPFFFGENYGMSLPLIAIHYSSLHLKLKLSEMSECIYFDVSNKNNSSVKDQIKKQIANLVYTNTVQIFKTQLEMSLLAEYAYLDSPERKKFAQTGHEYLITQVQELNFTNANLNNNSFDLQFFHCCKEVYWMLKQYKNINNLVDENIPSKYSVSINNKNYTDDQLIYLSYVNLLYNPFVLFNINVFIYGKSLINKNIIIPLDVNTYTQHELSPLINSSLLLNGYPIVNYSNNFYNYLQPYIYYNNTPSLGLNVYSFSLFPTETQPSGSINLSRIPKFSIQMVIYNDIEPVNTSLNIGKNNLNDYEFVFQCINYNVLRFIGGYVGLAYTY